MSRIFFFMLSCVALLVPATAQAWNYPLIITQKPYVPLPVPGGEPVQTPAFTDSTTSTDCNGVVLNLPFPVTYDGVVYNTIKAYTDGYVIFGGTTATCTSGNAIVPHTQAPNNAVFLYHDDLDMLDGPLKTQVVGSPGNRKFGVEWTANRWNTSFKVKMQLWLVEGSPTIFVHYGPKSGAATVNASMGIENLGGTLGTPGLLPNGTNCNPPATSSATGCNDVQFPSGYEYMYGATVEPDVVPSIVLGTVTEENGGTQLRIPITTTIANRGLQTADGIVWNYYFSRVSGFNPADPPVEPGHLSPQTVPGLSNASFTDIRMHPMPPAGEGEYKICVWLDPNGLIQESNSANNTGCSSNSVVIGADLVAEAINFVGVTAAVPGDLVSLSYRIRNIGTKPAGSFVYDLKLSPLPQASGGFAVHRGTVPGLAPGEVYQQTTQIRIPTNEGGEQFYPYLDVNPDRTVVEASRLNNGVSGAAKVTMQLPDVVPKALVVGPGAECFFGKELPISYQICNNGHSTAFNFADSLFMHDASQTSVEFNRMKTVLAIPEFCSTDADCTQLNQGVCIRETMGGSAVGSCHYGCVVQEDCGEGSQLSCAVDLDLGGQKSCQNALLASQCRTLNKIVTVPTVNYAGEALSPTRDYIFTVVLDPTEKLNEGTSVDRILNNVTKSARVQCRYPAPNLSALWVRPPARLAAGETIAISRKIENIGNEPAVVAYRYVLSTNEIGSDKDLRLPLVSTGGDGTLVLAPNGISEQTDLVSIPAHVTSQPYHLALVIDPLRTLVELDKTNNSVMASGQVFVEPSALQIRNQVLPEGRLGSFYGYQLVATGGTDGYVWSATGLPPFLTLDPNGYLSAERLMDDGPFSFDVTVRSGGAAMTTTVVLVVTEPLGPLTLNTSVLPVGYTFSTSPYRAPLSISGGVPPYVCTYQGMPNRFRLPAEDSCTIIASDGLENAGDYRFQVTVTDARMTRVSGALELSVRDTNKLAFKEHRFVHDGLIGEYFEECIESTSNRHVGRDTEDSVVYTWSIDSAPAGIALGSRNPDLHPPSKGCVSGVPTECGSFMVRLRVETRLGEDVEIDEWAEGEFPLTVQCRQLMLEPHQIAPVFPGDSVDVQLRATGPNADQTTFRLYAGKLPLGIVLESSGRLHGTVDDHADPGAYNFVLELRDGQGGYGLAGAAILVQPKVPVRPPVKQPKEGCSAAGESGAAGLLPFAAALLGLVGLGVNRRGAVARNRR